MNPSPVTTTHKVTDTMADTSIKVFYGNYSRHEEDPMTWMQSLNMRVANGWSNAKAVSIFESLLAEEKTAYKWWQDELRAANPNLDRLDWQWSEKPSKRDGPCSRSWKRTWRLKGRN